MLPDSDWRAEDHPGVSTRTSGGNKDRDNDGDQGGDTYIVLGFLRRSLTRRRLRRGLGRRDQKKPAQPKKNENCARRNVKVKGDTTEEECVAGVTRAQAKKRDRIYLLKVISYNGLCPLLTRLLLRICRRRIRLCFDCVGKPVIRENYVGEFYMKNRVLYRKH